MVIDWTKRCNGNSRIKFQIINYKYQINIKFKILNNGKTT
jgi:hypothetical protein